MKQLLLLPLVLALPLAAARAQDVSAPDYEFARDAVARGQILSLAEVLARLQHSHPGRVVEVELERDDDMLIYEVEMVTADGRLIEIEIDAATGRIIDLDEDPS
ncbi:Peptidase propeptide and YPEB domain-containing protein [Paracoccus aminovorans]|uniref:Peptidase propeptide and YPEB domain-containing protein n=1 Tax=Paracoccus aminovorans TaxID=34004 RepID=A0A1I3DY30_9RHOB|nr:PepSY domain-containing protein [Paracoccus aminovorans]CQR84252.1 putative peptidase [Paracoccus aminovorans]SFH91553.1 Peptidase propeptide and YPEB domain-containing protein [Paracoccus aminovorans]